MSTTTTPNLSVIWSGYVLGLVILICGAWLMGAFEQDLDSRTPGWRALLGATVYIVAAISIFNLTNRIPVTEFWTACFTIVGWLAFIYGAAGAGYVTTGILGVLAGFTAVAGVFYWLWFIGAAFLIGASIRNEYIRNSAN
ncbi:MAG TPA: DUF308 domain-containing protein [Patescibacteria group bacterium]|nr:DUF308 domain-containing protein [Patescibacteria group bacterium]